MTDIFDAMRWCTKNPMKIVKVHDDCEGYLLRYNEEPGIFEEKILVHIIPKWETFERPFGINGITKISKDYKEENKTEFRFENLEDLYDLEDLKNYREIENKFIRSFIEKEDEIVEQFFLDNLKNMTPNIKGKITKGKLRWRGITLCMQNCYPKKVWITQRGKQISKTLLIRLEKSCNSLNMRFTIIPQNAIF